MKINLTYLFILLFLLPIGIMAQDSTLNGKVIDESGEALIGATILIVGTDVGTATDIDGSFSLSKVTLPATLQVSYTGYKELSILVENTLPLELIMGEDSETLDEVIVVGYGKTEKRVATGAISKVSAKDLEGFVVSDVSSALEGQVTGLIVNESSGQPGASKTLLIRGISTNGDNSPLFIVDGLQVGNIDNIAAGDVESVDVLKDAASCAIYGARAANGVVIITTKKGKNEKGGTITYEGFMSQSTAWRTPKMLGASDYIDITREKFANSNQLAALETLGFPQAGAVTADTDWMDEVFAPASVLNHRLSVLTKNAYMSLEYWDQNGVIGGEKSNYQRYAVRLNSTKEVNKYITVGQNLYANRTKNENIGVNNAFGTVLGDAFAYDPITDVKNSNKQYGFEQSNWVKKEYVNPLSRLFLSNGEGHADALLGNAYLEVKPIKHLTIRSDFGFDLNWFQWRSFTPDYAFHDAFVNVDNDVAQGYGAGQSFQWENYANYNRTIANVHHLDFVVGTSYRESNFQQAGGTSSSIPDAVKFNPNWQFLDSGQDSTDLTFGSGNVDYALISYFGRVQYDFDKKYLFTATLRRDGSSNFGDNNRWGVFPSVSAGWVLSKEPFFTFKPISYLKLRASWGKNGSDRISPLSYAATIENVFTYSFGGSDQSLLTGAALATPPNPNVKWEESDQIDIGLEVELLEGKWTLDADIYRKTTKDLLMAEVIPGYIGATNNPISNLGEIRNQGIEIGIGNRIRRGDLTVTSRLSYTRFKNEVIKVAGDAGYLTGWSWPVRNTPITRMTEGMEVGHFVGYETDGIFQTQEDVFRHINADGDPLQPNAQPGDLIFKDTNGDGLINSDDIADIGSPWPDHVIGLSVGANYKGFDMSLVFAAQLGHQIFRAYERSDITYSNYQTFWLDRWTPENPGSKYPRLASNDTNNNQRPSDFYLEDGSFLRLRNFQVGYNIPTKVLEKVKIKEMRIYFSANNLLTLTDYQGFDPDIGTNGWILDTGIDKGAYPSNKTLGGGLKVTF